MECNNNTTIIILAQYYYNMILYSYFSTANLFSKYVPTRIVHRESPEIESQKLK
jgi:hypothetical protein